MSSFNSLKLWFNNKRDCRPNFTANTEHVRFTTVAHYQINLQVTSTNPINFRQKKNKELQNMDCEVLNCESGLSNEKVTWNHVDSRFKLALVCPKLVTGKYQLYIALYWPGYRIHQYTDFSKHIFQMITAPRLEQKTIKKVLYERTHYWCYTMFINKGRLCKVYLLC